MCVGLTPRLCECGCSEYDHEETVGWGVSDLGFPTGMPSPAPRGECNGRRLDYQDLASGPDRTPTYRKCECKKFRDMFEPDYTCRMP